MMGCNQPTQKLVLDGATGGEDEPPAAPATTTTIAAGTHTMLLNIVSTPAPLSNNAARKGRGATAMPRQRGRRQLPKGGRPQANNASAAAPDANPTPERTPKPSGASAEALPAGGRTDPPEESGQAADAPAIREARPPKRRQEQKVAHHAPAHSGAVRKEDPARAAALPRTPALDGSRENAAFSADRFAALPLDKYLQQQLGKMGLSTLTQVQRETIPLLLQGRDALVRSPTGSGKTLAYAVPLVQRLVALGPQTVTRAAGTFALILVPTRELAMQTHEAVEQLSRPFPWLVTSILMGGERKKAEKARLRKGVAVVVATPGRIVDHLESTTAFRLARCGLLVLDEADRLLDLGFQKTIAAILTALEERAASPAVRVTALLSATLSPGIAQLAGAALRDPAKVRLGASALPSAAAAAAAAALKAKATAAPAEAAEAAEAASASASGAGASAEQEGVLELEAPSQLQQNYAVLPPKQRLTALLAFLRSRGAGVGGAKLGGGGGGGAKLVVFFSSCDGVDFHFDLLGGGSERGGSWPKLHEAKITAGHAPANEDDREAAAAAAAAAEVEAMTAAPPSEAVVDSALLGSKLLRLHGNMDKKQRAAAFSSFRSAESGVLLCTDVAARGLNLQGVHWIVQYDLPSDPKEYVHRVGRAARLGQQGAALILLHPSEAPFLQLLQGAGMHLRELSFGSLQAALCPSGSTRDIYLLELALQRQLEDRVKRTPYLHAAASSAFQSYVRSYSAHSKAVQRVLHVGQLHLGHLAKSFGLRETPTAVAKQHTKRQRQTQPKETQRKRKGLALSERLQQRQKTAMPIGGFSEFAA